MSYFLGGLMPVLHEQLVDKKSFAAQLLALRTRANLSQAEIARRSKGQIAQAHYSQWELAAISPSVLVVPALAAALEIEAWEFLEDPSSEAKAAWEAHIRRLKRNRRKRSDKDEE